MTEDFIAGFKHAQALALWVLQYSRERGETDIRGHKSWIGSLRPSQTVEELQAEVGDEND